MFIALSRMFLLLVLGLHFCSCCWAGEAKWSIDIAQAKEQAKKDQKPLLVYFAADYSIYDRKIQTNLFESPRFQEWADRRLVLVRVDYLTSGIKLANEIKVQNEELLKKYKVEAFPCMLFLDAEGKELGRILGYRGEDVKAWIESTEKFLPKAKE